MWIFSQFSFNSKPSFSGVVLQYLLFFHSEILPFYIFLLLTISEVEMLRYCCGNRNIEKILLSGAMFTPAESLQLDLVDQVVTGDELLIASKQLAVEQSRHLSPAFTSLKRLARGPIAAEWMTREQQSILDWINVWYSPETRERARSVQIR